MAQQISMTPNLGEHQIVILLMDCFGKAQNIYVNLVDGPTMSDKIASTLASMTAAENTIKANCAAAGIDLTDSLAKGAAAIAAALAQAKSSL